MIRFAQDLGSRAAQTAAPAEYGKRKDTALVSYARTL